MGPMPIVPEAVIEEIRSRTDIVQVIGDRISLKRSSGGFVACCPFHHEKTPSFHVNVQMNREKLVLISVFIRIILGILLLDMSQGATNLALMDGLSQSSVTGVAILLGVTGILMLVTAIYSFSKIRKK